MIGNNEYNISKFDTMRNKVLNGYVISKSTGGYENDSVRL